MKTKLIIALSVIALAIIGSCNIYNPAEPVPSYIHIDNITVTVPSSMQSTYGSSSSKITDAWIYIDNQLIGCFQMPCTVPVLSDGVHALMIRPGIKVNGIAATRAPYPFYDNYYQTITLTRGQITTVTGAAVPYLASAFFRRIADFEGVGTIMKSTAMHASRQLKLIYAPNSFEGTSGLAVLRSTDIEFETQFDTIFPLNGGGANVFIEINYKCNFPLTVSLIPFAVNGASISQGPANEILTLSPSPNWNKEYLYVTPAISQGVAELPGTNEFQIYFDMFNYTGLDSLWYAMDNVKIVQ